MWINCEDNMPEDMEVVIALYLGFWSERGNGGITDAYAVDGVWSNLPENVVIIGWMPMPDTTHLPIAEHYVSSNINFTPNRLLGIAETDLPETSECIFEGDYSKIKRS